MKPQQISLDFIGRWINHLPFWITPTILAQFEAQQIKPSEALLYSIVNQLLSASRDSIRQEHGALLNSLKNLQQHYQQYHHAGLELFEQKSVDISADLIQWIGQIQGYGDSLMRDTRLSALKSGGAVRRRLEDKTFQRAKQIQHELFVATQGLENFDQFITENKIRLPAQEQWLEIKHYSDLILLSYLLKADAVEPALRCKQQCIEKSKQLFHQKKSVLIKFMGVHFYEIIRWQRCILVYKQWQRHLQTILPHHIATFSPLQRQMALRENIQYQKRTYFKERFQQQKAYLVINALYRLYKTSVGIQQLKLDLSQEKNRLQQDIVVLERQLLSGLSLFQSLSSNCALAATRQPAFQCGQLAARAALHELDRHPNWPYLGAKLPPAQVQRIEQVNGLVFLCLSTGLTSWLGSSYELVSTLNPLLWANYCVLDQLGRRLEHAAHRTITPVFNAVIQKSPQSLARFLIRMKNYIRLDEQGLAEKETLLNWLTHLITHLGMSVGFFRQSVSASLAGYSLGTACAGSASLAVENIMQYYDHDPDQIQITKTLVYLTVYSIAYHQGYILAHHHLGIGYDRISDAQALQRLGLYNKASELEVKKRYHQLSLKNHVDKCKTQACSEKWTEITEAYEVLMKKRT